MKFNEVLNRYLEELDCTAKKLSIESGLTRSVICRYRSGERKPIKNSEQLKKYFTSFCQYCQPTFLTRIYFT